MKAPMPAEREALMAAPGREVQRYCPICGRTDLPIEMHHVVPRSLGGKDGPTLPLCRACHEAADGYSVALRYSGTDWLAKPLTEDYAGYLSVRRGHTHHVGGEYPLVFGAENFDEREKELAELANNVTALDAYESDAWRTKAECVYKAQSLCTTRTHFVEWREGAGLSRPAASKMLTVVEYLDSDELRSRPMLVQYEAARLVKDGVADRGDITADAEVLSVTDLRIKYRGEPEPADKVECPRCGSKVLPKRLEEGTDE